MKRFYKTVSVDGRRILLDGRSVRTPARAVLELPGVALAGAIAAEWEEQGEEINLVAMPFTGLAHVAIDRIAPDCAGFAAGLARYGESDLTCYRAEGPDALVVRQAAAWEPLLDWARTRYDVRFTVTAGIIHVTQPAATVARLGEAAAARDAFALAGLFPLVTISGSLVIALAVAEGAIDAQAGFAAAMLDEDWQAERWGEDALASQARAARERDFHAAAHFLALAGTRS